MLNGQEQDRLAREHEAERSEADVRRKKLARAEGDQDWAGDDARDQGE